MEETNNAFSEVYSIINHLDKNLYNKIPKKFIECIENNRNSQYQPNIDYNKSINAQNLLKETRIILSLIYRDYICSPAEKARLTKEDAIQLKKEEKEIFEKHKVEDIFKRNNVEQIEENTLVKQQENIFTKIFNKIKSFFKKQSKVK